EWWPTLVVVVLLLTLEWVGAQAGGAAVSGGAAAPGRPFLPPEAALDRVRLDTSACSRRFGTALRQNSPAERRRHARHRRFTLVLRGIFISLPPQRFCHRLVVPWPGKGRTLSVAGSFPS